MPTEKQEDLDNLMPDDDTLDQDLDDEDMDEQDEDERVGMGSPMGSALDAEDHKRGDVPIDDDRIGDDATD